MDIQTILTVIGISATILFGIWAVVITIRFNRGVQITYAEDQCIALIDDITQSFPELSINFRNEPVSDNIVFLKGYLINSGRKDISKDMVEERISISLPRDFEWIDCKVVDTSKSLKASVRKSDNTKVEFDMGLWKAKEYLKFDALAKVPVIKVDVNESSGEKPNTRLRKALSFSHRIADSNKIQVTRVPRIPGKFLSLPSFPFRVFQNRFLGMISGIITIGFGIFMFFYPVLKEEKVVGYNIQLDGENRTVLIKVKDEKINLSDKKGFNKELSLDEFNNLQNKQIILIPYSDRSFKIIAFIYFGMGVFLLFVNGLIVIREKRILGLIARQEKT